MVSGQTSTTSNVWQLDRARETMRYYLNNGLHMTSMMLGTDGNGFHN